MAELAIFIKTFLKEKTIVNCIETIEKNLSDIEYRIYIADDGPVSEHKKNRYHDLKKKGHKVLELPFNIGASASRNALLLELNEESFVLRLDDDFEITNDTKIAAMMEVLKIEKKIGIIADLERQIGHGKSVQSGRINPWQGFLQLQNGYLIKKMQPLKKFNFHTISGIRIAKSDFTRNMLLIKREVFNDVCWDDNLFFANEHVDFLLQLQQSKWDVVFTPDSIHLHRDDLSQADAKELFEEYKKIKNNNSLKTKNNDYFLEKWNLKGIKIKRTPEIYREKIRSVFSRIIKCQSSKI
jgi:GT2 family glycosyltransferase